MALQPLRVNWLLGLLGAVAGGAVGYGLYFGLWMIGIYALALPGIFVGLGCGALSRGKSWGLAIVCGLIALPLGIVSEWSLRPFRDDQSLGYFLTHLNDLTMMTMFMIALGTGVAVWSGLGRDRYTPLSENPLA